MVSLGAFLAVRDFECILCGRPFSRMTADLLLPEDQVCDDCLGTLGPLDENDLRAAIAQRQPHSKENRDL
jgi:hypothetical protein